LSKRAVSGIMLVTLLIGMLTLAFNIQPVKAEGTVYIRADGSIDPPTAPLRCNGNFYALTGNISTGANGIVIEKSNIVLDGEGYFIQGTNMGIGILLSEVSNVEIMNLEVKNFSIGIYLSEGSKSNRISAVNAVNNGYGLLLEQSSDNMIFANNILKNMRGVGFSNSSNNRFYYINFIENGQHVYDFALENPTVIPSINIWDDGYSWGGNYWSDYVGVDANEDDIGDTPYIIDSNNVDYHPICSHKPLHPGYYETSEFLIGSIAVGVILPESNGMNDPNTENWTETEESKVVAKITNALNWLKAYNPSANISFSMEINYRVPTSLEPISRWYSEYPLWVTETIYNLGYRSILDYVNNLRNRLRTDWAFILFIVDSSNDADGCFPEGYDAGAIIGGPFVISTTRWINGFMDAILAHEICHLFYATDEYNGVREFSGYLNCPDADGAICLMTSNAWRLCKATQQQLGWRDTDGDGIPDIIDTFPKITMDMHQYQEANGILTYTGFVTEDPYHNSNPYSRPRWPDWQEVFFRIPKTRRSITVNTITKVEYRIDDGPWMNATPVDGDFDEAQEYFTLNISASSLGNHSIDLRAMNTVGNIAFLYGSPPLSASISPPSSSILVGQSVNFTSTVNGGTPPYNYQWYLNNNPVSDATTSSWAFTPTATGSFTIYLNVTDNLGNSAKSNETIVTVAPQLSVSISPTSASILVGRSVTFTSTVSGGYTPYSYQWYLNGNPVSSETSASWTFTPTTSGIYHVYLKATDAKGNLAQSDTARITVATIPVGGYSIPIQSPKTAKSLTPYLILTAILIIALTTIKRKTTRKTKKPP